MSETADLNDSTELLFTAFRGRLFQFRIVCIKKDWHENTILELDHPIICICRVWVHWV